MKQLEANVAAVMKYLKDEGFSHSVISEHRLCYEELFTFLTSSGKNYSPEVVYQWIEDNESSWPHWRYKGWRHCIDQLEDVRKEGSISLDHLSYRKPAYNQLDPPFRAILDCILHHIAQCFFHPTGIRT